MEIVISLVIGLLVQGAIIAAIVYGVLKLVRRRRGPSDADPGVGTVRRLYLYVVTLVALTMSAAGVVFIASFVIESIFVGGEVSASTTRQALGLSMTVVGLPLWWLHWRLINRHIVELPVETRSVVRKLFIYLVLAISAILAVQAAIEALNFVFRTTDFDGYPWAAMIVWGGVWAFHWRLETAEGQATPETLAVRRVYLYVVTGFTLVMAAAGLGQLVNLVLREAYDALVSPPVVASTGLSDEQTRRALILLLVAGPVWAAHWMYFARDDDESVLRQLYLYGLAQFVPFVTVFVAAVVTLNQTLVWAIGAPEDAASEHFRFLVETLTFAIVAGGVLAYHRSVAEREAYGPSSEAGEAHGAYPYAPAALGLAALSFALAVLVDAVLGYAVDRDAAVSASDMLRNNIALSVSVGVLAGALWWFYWNELQARLATNGPEERRGHPRRIYLAAVQGVGMIALLGGLSVVVFAFFRGVLEADLTEFAQDARGGLATLVPVAIFLPYHWLVYREDRRLVGDVEEERRERKSVTVFASEDGWEFVEQLEQVLGYAVTPLEWADKDAGAPEMSADDFDDLVRRIGNAAGSKVLLVPDNGSLRLLSYE